MTKKTSFLKRAWCALSLAALVGMGSMAPAQPGAPAPAGPPAGAKPAGPVVLRVNGVEITQGQLDEVADQMAARENQQMMMQGNMPSTATTPTAASRQVMLSEAKDRLIGRTLLEQAVNKQVPEVKPEAVKAEMAKIEKSLEKKGMNLKDVAKREGISEDEITKQITQQLALVKVVEQNAGPIKPTDAELKEIYAKHKDKMQEKEKLRTSHILLGYKGNARDPNFKPAPGEREALKKKADEVLAKVKSGEDFAKLAKENSSCPSAAQGGDLNFNERGVMDKAFDDAAWKLKQGEVSGVVETKFGFHIIKATGHQDAKTPTFEEMKDQLSEMVTQQKLYESLESVVQKLRAGAQIEDLQQAQAPAAKK